MRSQETVQAQKNLEGCGVPGAEGFLDQLCRSESFDSLLRLWPNCWERGKGKITPGAAQCVSEMRKSVQFKW